MSGSLKLEMMKAYSKAAIGYMQSGEPSPDLIWIMPPEAYDRLRFEIAADDPFLIMHRHDGILEFLNCRIRIDHTATDWRLCPA